MIKIRKQKKPTRAQLEARIEELTKMLIEGIDIMDTLIEERKSILVKPPTGIVVPKGGLHV